MRAILQRVTEASVKIDHKVNAAIGHGLMILLGITDQDGEDDIAWLSMKVINMRIFNDNNMLMNLSVKDVQGDILLVSQFTLYASTKKGNRPSFIAAAKPEFAIPLYERMIDSLQTGLGRKIGTGVFGADMKVSMVNDGPVTIYVDSRSRD